LTCNRSTECLNRYRLKEIESRHDPAIPVTDPFVIRLDGVSFSTFTKGLKKPFDERITDAFVQTTHDLVHKFSAVTGYTQSDEISLIFPAAMEPVSSEETDPASTDSSVKKIRPVQRQHIYSGRMFKLASVTSSFASARFNYHLNRHSWTDLSPSIQKKVQGHEAFFDGRVIPLPDPLGIAECIFWRSNCDGLRNSISHISQHSYSAQELHGKGLRQQLMMLHEKDINVVRDYPLNVLFGTWVKKEQYEMSGIMHPITGLPIPGKVIRARLRDGSFNWADWTPEQRSAFLMAKYWTDDPGLPPKSPLREEIQ
jgi:tRNA(His) guanylyltransferase